MTLFSRLLFAFISLTGVLLHTSRGAEPPKQTKNSSANTSRSEKKPVHLSVRSQADIKQTFTYSPHPSVPDELQGYAGSQVGGTGTYRMVVDAQGKVNQVMILKGFTVTAVYDERFSDVKGNTVPALDKVMLQALMRWRAKPGPGRVVDIYWSFGTQPWMNYGKSNVSE
jgi:hypothetical protein